MAEAVELDAVSGLAARPENRALRFGVLSTFILAAQ